MAGSTSCRPHGRALEGTLQRPEFRVSPYQLVERACASRIHGVPTPRARLAEALKAHSCADKEEILAALEEFTDTEKAPSAKQQRAPRQF